MKSVKKFYNTSGWKLDSGKNTKDACLWEDLRECAREYVSFCRIKIIKHLSENKKGIMLDFASGPIQYKEYMQYSKNFKKRYCVDFSKDALKQAKIKLGKKGMYFCKDFAKINFKENFFDCSLSMHTLYHIKQKQQKHIVRKLIKVTKKNSNIIIVYSNPNNIWSKINFFFKNNKKIVKKNLYFFAHNLQWWDQFNDDCFVTITCWRSLPSNLTKKIFPNNFIGMFMFKIFIFLEKNLPKIMCFLGTHPMIILKKK